jgi:recombination protein RecA
MKQETAMPSAADREKALETALAQIDRQFGKGSVMRLGSDERAPVAVIPTGSIALDVALGIGGLPRGRIIEIYGPESSGKTTLTLHAIANVQKAGGIAAFIDAEHALDPEYAQKLGVDIDQLLVSQPDTGEQALEIADMLVRSGSIDLVVIDSVAALVPRAEIEGEMGDSHVGLQARLMSQALRKLTGGLNSTQTSMIFINQLREKIGVFFGSPETTSGGKALKFYASVRLDIRRIETLKDGTEAVGNRTRVKVVKNKMAPPFKQAEFDILYGVGISREGSLIDFGVEHEIVRKSGAWYTYEGDQLGQGKENARNFLIDNPAMAVEIENKILAKLGIGAKPAAAEPVAATAQKTASEKSTSKASAAKAATAPVVVETVVPERGATELGARGLGATELGATELAEVELAAQAEADAAEPPVLRAAAGA